LISITYLVPSLFLPESSASHAMPISLASIWLTSGQIWCLAQNATHSSVALIPPMRLPWMLNLLNIMKNWLKPISLGIPPTHDKTPFFFKHDKVAIISWCTATVSIIKSHDYANCLSDSGSPVTQTWVAPFFIHVSTLSLDRVNATTSCPIALASLTPMVPKPPMPTMPTFIFLPLRQPLSTRGDHIVTPAHIIGAMLASGMPEGTAMA